MSSDDRSILARLRRFVGRPSGLNIALYIALFGWLVFQAIQHQTKVAEAQHAYAFAQGAWCNDNAVLNVAPAGEDVGVAYRDHDRVFNGRANVSKLDDGILISILTFAINWEVRPEHDNESGMWMVSPVNASTVRIWHVARPGEGGGSENWTRCA